MDYLPDDEPTKATMPNLSRNEIVAVIALHVDTLVEMTALEGVPRREFDARIERVRQLTDYLLP